MSRLVALGLTVVLVGASDPDPPLVEAAKENDGELLRTLVERGENVRQAAKDGTTALHWLSYWDDLAGADLLIRAGADVDAATDLGVSPLWPASLNGSEQMVRKLLLAGADPNASLLLGETLIMTAARSGNPEVARLLLAAGADVNAQPKRPETTPCLFDASRHCALQAGGQTALMWAVAQKHSEVVRVLLDHGADVHARSQMYGVMHAAGYPAPVPENKRAFPHGKDTALTFAARVGDLASVQLLVVAGADVNDADAFMSALALAAYWDHADVAEFLLEEGADPNLAQSELDPLHLAILNRNYGLVGALLAHGADPSAPLKSWTHKERGSRDRSIHPAMVGATPIWIAARFGTPQMIRLLLDAGANPAVVHHSAYYDNRLGSLAGELAGIDTPRVTQNTTALMAAVGMGGPGGELGSQTLVDAELAAVERWPERARDEHEAEVLEIVALLLDAGADLHAVNVFDRTCKVPWEVPPGQERVCVEVATPDENLGGRFSPPRTALDGAIALKFEAVAEFLIAHGATPQALEW